MKKKIIILTTLTASFIILMAFMIKPQSFNEKKQSEFTTQISVQVNDTSNIDGAPCACSKYQCECGYQLEWSAIAYKEYLGKCKACNGTGRVGSKYAGYQECSLCEGTGREWEWHSGCVCKNCGNVYLQPNDC